MICVSLNIYCAKWASRAQILTSSATDTALNVDNRNLTLCISLLILSGDHRDSPHRTVFRTASAVHAIGQDDTILLNPYSVTNLSR